MITELPEVVCEECRKREATLLCDFVVGKYIDIEGPGKITKATCDKKLCEKCTRKINTRDYCKKHFEELRKEVE